MAWNEVFVVAKKIQEYMKEELENRKKEQAEYDPDGQPADSEPGEPDDSDSPSPTEGDDEGIEGAKGENQEDDLESKTDNKFRDREKELYSQKTERDLQYGNIPNVNSDDIIIGYKQIVREIKQQETGMDIKIPTNLFAQFRNDVKKTVAYLAKEFELRKNADMMKKVSIAKTGDLNMNRIFSYQFSEDIFKKISVMPDGKSHGLILFLDWSGSMERQMADTVKQLLTLVLFCKSVQIPFEVYAFTNFYYTTDRWKTEFMDIKYKDGDIKMEKMNLLNLFSSKMTMADMNFIGNALLDEIFRGYTATARKYYQDQQRWDYKKYENFTLGGTQIGRAHV